jgi:NAD(P)-dependent dehydrogenase (short-subunit alcohol dehydrogenase family)
MSQAATTAVVVGDWRGLGRGIAKAFPTEGYRVVAVGPAGEALDNLAAAHPETKSRQPTPRIRTPAAESSSTFPTGFSKAARPPTSGLGHDLRSIVGSRADQVAATRLAADG